LDQLLSIAKPLGPNDLAYGAKSFRQGAGPSLEPSVKVAATNLRIWRRFQCQLVQVDGQQQQRDRTKRDASEQTACESLLAFGDANGLGGAAIRQSDDK